MRSQCIPRIVSDRQPTRLRVDERRLTKTAAASFAQVSGHANADSC
jgi:hypothetical protein